MAAVSLFALAACSGTGDWAKAGSSDDQIKRDYAACQREASTQMSQAYNIDSDILSTRGRDWQRNGMLDQKITTLQSQERPRTQSIVAQCMLGRGYVPAD